jgi:predicted Zn-dependent protease
VLVSRLKENPKFPEGINYAEENPLKEFFVLVMAVSSLVVAGVVVLVLAAKLLAPAIPFSWELKLTSVYERSLSDQTASDDNSKIDVVLTDLGSRLLPNMTSSRDIDFTFHYLDDSTPNAFATLGGHIFVTRGLLAEVDSENGLAMVLAHEMAHVTHRHPIQSLSRGAIMQLVFAMVFENQGGAVESILGQAGLVTLLSFNRDMERESDADAVIAVQGLYGHLAGANEFFVKMKQQSGSSRWTRLFETHPGLDDRIQMISSASKGLSLDGGVKPLSADILALRE